MCKATPLQHNGVEITPENTLRVHASGRLQNQEQTSMQTLAMDLGYQFYLHAGTVYATGDSTVTLAIETDVFDVATPMCKGKAALAARQAKTIPIVAA